jgi:tetratricopeptide (TPR) repeat protein
MLVGFSQQAKEKQMPVTTNSKSGLSYYSQAMKYYEDVNLKESIAAFRKALNQDPDFFIVNYQLALYFRLNQSDDNFEVFADAAIDCKSELSAGEELLKEVLVNFKQGHSDVINIGKKLVEMYPGDPNSYNNLVSFQSLAGDSAGMVETLIEAIKIFTNRASFYNQLGYSYLTLNQNDMAEKAFNKYIELDPKNPNVYDSKGDYFMFIKKYYEAYESYMTAYSMDPSFSHEKAMLAKELYERTTGKKLEIISI